MKNCAPDSRLPSHRLPYFILAAGLLAPLTSFAELSNETMVGAGLRSLPVYDGASTQRVDVVPIIRYLDPFWLLRSTQGVLEGGARVEVAPGLHLGAQVAYESGRNPERSDFLKNHHVAGINPGASYGVHLEWDQKIGPMPITLLARLRQNTDADRGAQADVRLSAGVFSNGRVDLGVFTQSTWASEKSNRFYYGITPPQSAIMGLPAYRSGSGWLTSSAGLLWSAKLVDRWMAVGSVEARHLHGSAANSPLVERATNAYVSAGVAYRF